MGNKKKYSWWDDPQNAKIVEGISWWELPENKTAVELPVSIIKDDEYWTMGTNNETKKLIGERLSSIVVSAKTKEDAIRRFFILLKSAHNYSELCRLKYQRWVPFRKGPWGSVGGRWVAVFGIFISFRYGKGMKGGHYIPLTKLNVSIRSEWNDYKKVKQD